MVSAVAQRRKVVLRSHLENSTQEEVVHFLKTGVALQIVDEGPKFRPCKLFLERAKLPLLDIALDLGAELCVFGIRTQGGRCSCNVLSGSNESVVQSGRVSNLNR